MAAVVRGLNHSLWLLECEPMDPPAGLASPMAALSSALCAPGTEDFLEVPKPAKLLPDSKTSHVEPLLIYPPSGG